MKHLIKITLLLWLITGSAGTSSAQMSGSVTIDSISGASSTNFKTWFSFWRSLQGQTRNDGGPTQAGGISGALTVKVITNLTDTSRVQFPAITGTSSTKTITIDGNGKILTYGKGGDVIVFKGGDYITIKNLTIRNAGSSASANTCIRFYNQSDNNTIKKCTLEFSGLGKPSVDGSAFVAFAEGAALRGVTSTLTGSFNLIDSNLCRTISSSSAPAFGMVVTGSNSGYKSTAHNNTISNNTIQNFYYIALSSSNSNGNLFSGNDIARANSSSNDCNQSLYAFVITNTFCSGRSGGITGNTVHDLPYAGASGKNGVDLFYGIYGLGTYGNSSYNMKISGNTFKNICTYSYVFQCYLRSSDFTQFTDNVCDKLSSFDNNGGYTMTDIVTGDEFEFSRNTVRNCDFQGSEMNVFLIDSLTASKSGMVSVNDNLLENNTVYYDGYLFNIMNGDYQIQRNKIWKNSINGGSGGSIYAFLMIDYMNVRIMNNVVADNVGDDAFVAVFAMSFVSGGNYTFEFYNNTLAQDGSTNSNPNYDLNSAYLYPYYHTDIRVAGNIIYQGYANSGVPMGVDNAGTTAVSLFDNNTYYTFKMNSEYWFVPGGLSASDFSGWTSLGTGGTGENFANPGFVNFSSHNFKSTKWQTQNNVPYLSVNPKDINGVQRNTVKCDRGAYENNITDIKAVSSNFNPGSSVCTGYSTPVNIVVRNKYSDTAYGFNVSYRINGGSKVSQLVKKKILPNDTAKVTFSAPVVLNAAGTLKFEIFADVPDDSTYNDTLKFSTTVNKSPGGSSFVPSTVYTVPAYRKGNPYEVTWVKTPIGYNMPAPTGYTNSQYGSQWTASAWAATVAGRLLPSSEVSLTNPSGTDLSVKYVTTDYNMEDTLLYLYVKFKNLSNLCDTTLRIKIRIDDRVRISVKYPSVVCGSDTAKFTNFSSYYTGAARYHWDFGTGNPADTSADSDPYFVYKTPGTYKVKLIAIKLPYGFKTYDSGYVTVSQKPVAKFTRKNACDGNPLSFTNQTTPASGVTYKWDFGDGSISTNTNPTHTYATEGLYNAKLVATYQGCKDSVTLKVQQYPKPKASFSVQSGRCTNENIQFSNLSTILSGIISSYWDFKDGSTSVQSEPSHKFANPGTKNVKLIVVSDLGCKDSVVYAVSVYEAPKVAFTNSEECARKSTQFYNSTPTVSGTTQNYSWTFSDGGKSTAKSPSHAWASTGTFSARLVVTQDNGCADSFSKTFVVKPQAKAEFSSNAPVCTGTAVNFTNQTTFTTGKISYFWDFADGFNSSANSPSHSFSVNKTTTFMVILIVKTDTACPDSVIKSVTVNQMSKTCQFVASPDYTFGFYGMKFYSVDGTGNATTEAGTDYTWTINGSNYTGPLVQVNLPGDGSYDVSYCAITNSNPKCTCCTTQKVVMDRAKTNLAEGPLLHIFPNPNTGMFRISGIESYANAIPWELRSMNGSLVLSGAVHNESETTIFTGSVAPGIYLMNIDYMGKHQVTRIEIR